MPSYPNSPRIGQQRRAVPQSRPATPADVAMYGNQRGARPTSQQSANTRWGDENRQPGLLPTDPLAPGGLLPEDMTNATEAELEAYVRQTYGFMGGFLNIPDVRQVLLDAARNQWDSGRLQGALFATPWWRTTSAAQRQWAQLVSEDPASAEQQLRQQSAIVHDKAKTLGIVLSPTQVNDMARMVTQNGWTSEEYIDSLIGQVDWNTVEGGQLTYSRDRVKEIGSAYLVDVSSSTAQNYAARIAAGEMTEEAVMSIMRQQAKGRFSWMSDQIDQGVTVRDYLMPIRDRIASELEMAPDEIDLMDSEWLSLVETRDDKGQLRAATLNEAMLAARKKPQYANTQKAQQMTTSLIGQLGQIFGRA